MEAEIEIAPPNGQIVKSDGPAPKPTTPRAIMMAEALKEESEQRALLQAYVTKHMSPGTDYGVIPGTQKPTLLKPGAEKLTDLFRCTPEFELTERIEDFDKGLFHYEFRVRIKTRDTGTVLAEGVGSANSREGRYRWRNASRKCPTCSKETIIKGKTEYGGGWVCFRKKGGCGAKFADGDEAVEGQESGRVENDDVYTLVNTILKMAKKRALVDGAIALARCSDIFTQDIEDLEEGGESHGPVDSGLRPDVVADAPAPAPKGAGAPSVAPPPYVMALWARAKGRYGRGAQARIEAAARAHFGATPKRSTEWTPADAAAVEAIVFDESEEAP